MASTREPNHHERHFTADDNGHAASAAEAIARSHAQTRELRERSSVLVQSLNTYVTYELRRRVRLSQIASTDLVRDEVVDSAFAAALARLNDGHEIRDLENYLKNRASEMIGREVRRIQHERRQHVSLEQTIASASESEEGEDVRVVDIIEDENAREPEQVVIDNETVSFMIGALTDVPDLWRTVFLQRTMQERTAREVAELEGLDIDEVRRITIRTREYLRERFEDEYGFDFFEDE